MQKIIFDLVAAHVSKVEKSVHLWNKHREPQRITIVCTSMHLDVINAEVCFGGCWVRVFSEVWFGGWGRGVYITGLGQGGNLPSLSTDHCVLNDSFWHCSRRQAFCKSWWKKKKRTEFQRQQMEKGRKKGSQSCVQELNQWLEHSHLTTGSHTV